MTRTEATEEYIEFLRERSSVTHIVSSPAHASISPLALTQRCLASGVSFPVPLPDGTVAINVADGVPPALKALDLHIEAIDPAGPDALEEEFEAAVAPAEPTPSASVEMPHEGEEVGAPTTSAPEPHPPVETEQSSISFDAIEPESESSPGDFEMEEIDGTATHLEQGDVDDVSGDAPPFIRQTGRQPLAISSAENASDESDVTEPAVKVGIAKSDEQDGAWPGGVTATTDSMPADTTADAETRDQRMERMLTILTDLEHRLDMMERGQSGLSERIDHFSGALSAAVSRPVPRPDVSEFNRGLAKLTTALAQVIRRLDDAVEQFAQQPETPDGTTITTLSTRLSDLESHVEGLNNGQNGARSELALVSSMQETMSHQLARLLETRQVEGVPMMEEFLLDLRHATAELLAEQTRIAQAG